MYNGTRLHPVGKKRTGMCNPKDKRKYNLGKNKPVLGASDSGYGTTSTLSPIEGSLETALRLRVLSALLPSC